MVDAATALLLVGYVVPVTLSNFVLSEAALKARFPALQEAADKSVASVARWAVHTHTRAREAQVAVTRRCSEAMFVPREMADGRGGAAAPQSQRQRSQWLAGARPRDSS